MGQTVSILIFLCLTRMITSVTRLLEHLKLEFLEEIDDDSSFVGAALRGRPSPETQRGTLSADL